MTWDAPTIIALITSVGVGGVLQTLVGWLKDRKKNGADAAKTDVETKLTILNNVIERLDGEAKRFQDERDRYQEALVFEQQRAIAERARMQAELDVQNERNATLRNRVRELEDEIDVVRKSVREAEHNCSILATRIKELVADVEEKA